MIQLLFYMPIDFKSGPMAEQNRMMILQNAIRFFSAGGKLDSNEWGALTFDQQNLLIEAQAMVQDAVSSGQPRVPLYERAKTRAAGVQVPLPDGSTYDPGAPVAMKMGVEDDSQRDESSDVYHGE